MLVTYLLKILNRLFFLFFILYSKIIFSAPGNSSNLKPSCQGASCTWCNFFSDFKKWLDFLVENIAIPAGLVLIVFSGILYIFSGSFPSLTNKAKNTIIYSLIGVLIIVSAWTIVSLIMKIILKDPNINPWTGISC